MKFSAIAKRRAIAIFRKTTLVVLCVFCLTATEFGNFGLQKNRAYACIACVCASAGHALTQATIIAQHGIISPTFFSSDPENIAYLQAPADVCTAMAPFAGTTRGWIAYQFCRHREEFIVFNWFKEHLMAAMMMMTEQLVGNAMNQMFIIGTFFDAKIQLGTQRMLQEMEAQAHKDYHPSFGMCEIGTLSRSLAASQRQGEFSAYTLSQHLQKRQTRNYAMSSAAGKGPDILHRWTQFHEMFCNPYDNDQLLGPSPKNPTGGGRRVICSGTSLTATAPRDDDVDYTRTVDYPLTIDADFSVNAITPKEQAVFALASNLYGHDVFDYFPESFFQNGDNQDEYMYLRAMVAKRSVAQNSFDAIVGMKTAGHDPQTVTLRGYMEKVLEQLGIVGSGTTFQDILGTNPSYYAQMEILTKKLYQRPEFYTDLYDKPVNVERKKAALRAIGLMQNMDMFKSKLRTEAALAVLTDLELNKQQKELQNRFSETRTIGNQ